MIQWSAHNETLIPVCMTMQHGVNSNMLCMDCSYKDLHLLGILKRLDLRWSQDSGMTLKTLRHGSRWQPGQLSSKSNSSLSYSSKSSWCGNCTSLEIPCSPCIICKGSCVAWERRNSEEFSVTCTLWCEGYCLYALMWRKLGTESRTVCRT